MIDLPIGDPDYEYRKESAAKVVLQANREYQRRCREVSVPYDKVDRALAEITERGIRCET